MSAPVSEPDPTQDLPTDNPTEIPTEIPTDIPTDLTEIAAGAATSTIDVGADCVTLINVFTVEPDHQARLIELLESATESVIRHQPGFISANLHAALDGVRVTNYAQWASVEDMQAMLENPACQPHLQECSAIAESDPHVYRVASVHHR